MMIRYEWEDASREGFGFALIIGTMLLCGFFSFLHVLFHIYFVIKLSKDFFVLKISRIATTRNVKKNVLIFGIVIISLTSWVFYRQIIGSGPYGIGFFVTQCITMFMYLIWYTEMKQTDTFIPFSGQMRKR
jgi:hypothetical protein